MIGLVVGRDRSGVRMKKAPPMRGVARWGRPSRPDVARHEQRDALLNSRLRRSPWEAPTRWKTDEVASALLLDVMYRSLVRQEACWDLLAIVVLAGAVSTVYQWRHKVLTGHSFKLAAVTMGVAGVVAVVIAAIGVLR